MRWTRITGVLGVALVACNRASTPDLHRFVRAEDEDFARAYVDSVRLERIDYAMSELSPVLAGMPNVRDSLIWLSRRMPHGVLDSVHLIGAYRFRNSSMDRSELTYEYHSAGGWGVASVGVLNEDGRRWVDDFHSQALARTLEAVNAFTLRDKSFGHFLMLGLMVVCLAAAFGSAVVALFTPMKRRWAWALLSLVGTGTFAFNWTTGQGRLMFLNVLLFDAGVMKAGSAAPWVLQVAFPVGALLTLRRVRTARRPPAPVVAATPPAEAAPVEAVAPAMDAPNESGT